MDRSKETTFGPERQMDRSTFHRGKGCQLLQSYIDIVKPPLQKGKVYVLQYTSLQNAVESLSKPQMYGTFMGVKQTDPFIAQILNSGTEFVKYFKNIHEGTLILLAIQTEDMNTSFGSSIFLTL
jgi:hypothetical protein